MNLTRRGRRRFVSSASPPPRWNFECPESKNLALSQAAKRAGRASRAAAAVRFQRNPASLFSAVVLFSHVRHLLQVPPLTLHPTGHRLAGGQGRVGQEVRRGRGRGPLQPHPGHCPLSLSSLPFTPLHPFPLGVSSVGGSDHHPFLQPFGTPAKHAQPCAHWPWCTSNLACCLWLASRSTRSIQLSHSLGEAWSRDSV
jgi:hypothetical protein